MPKSRILTIAVPSGLVREEQIRRLEIAMDDAERVRVREPLERLQRVVDGVADRQLMLEPQELLEIAPVEPLHHHVRQAVDEHADVHHARDVRAVDARRGARLGEEPLDDLRQARQLRREELHRDRLVEQHVVRCKHDRHPAFAE